MNDAGAIEVGADDWAQKLLPDLSAADLARLGPDLDILFDGLVECLEREPLAGVEVRKPEASGRVAADAPLLLTGVRVHIQAGSAVRQTIFDAVKFAAIFALAGSDPLVGSLGLSVDFGRRLFEKATRLDRSELEIVTALATLGRGSDGPPTLAELGEVLPDVDGLEGRLAVLEEKGVIAGQGGGWTVAV